MKKQLTLALLVENERILLGMKKEGFGAGRWNGFGGKVEPGESIEQAAVREVYEESDIKVTDYEKAGVIEFEFKGNPVILEVHIYKITRYNGEPKETNEMIPKWFPIKDIPYQQMWPDDKYWMPLFLAGKKFKGKILFQDQDTILESRLDEVTEIA